MDRPIDTEACLSCDRNESEAPLLDLRFRGDEVYICSQCLPVLIHNPGKLEGRLKGAEEIGPSPHRHE